MLDDYSCRLAQINDKKVSSQFSINYLDTNCLASLIYLKIL